MIILHAGINDGQLYFWGEAPPDSTAPNKQHAKTPSAKPLPYDAGPQALIAGLLQIASDLKFDARVTRRSTVWLPGANGQPTASSPLIAEPLNSRANPTIDPWTVTTLPMTTGDAINVLCHITSRGALLAQGVIAGSDLAFWASAMRFAGTLVSRQQFLPTLETRENSYRARWDPILDRSDENRASQLACAMPNACRAVTSIKNLIPPGIPAMTVLRAFLNEAVDYLVRDSCAGTTRDRRSFDSVHDRWLYALRASNGVIEIANNDLAALVDQVREWRRPISVTAASPFRLCFRLEEPDEESVEGNAVWYLRYLLQAVADHSLIVPVADAWDAKGRAKRALKHGEFNPREYLLSALGQAAGLSARIEESLMSAAPSGYQMNSVGAHEFLNSEALLLEQAGFGVMLPAWWSRKGTKLRLSARAIVKSPKMQASGGLSLNQLVQLNWQLALGGETLSLKELQTLAKLKEPLVKVRGQWVELNAVEIQAALDFWKGSAERKATLREVVQMSLGKADSAGGLDVEGVIADGWIAEWLAKLEGQQAPQELEVPVEFKGTLRPYQVRGYSWLGFLREWGLGACLADDMGLGKTVQALALIEREWHQNGKRPVLLVCPTSVIGNWQKEAARFTPGLSVMAHHGITRAKGSAFKKEAAKHAIVISSYSLLQRDIEVLADVDWSGVILDEAQNIKNPEARQSKAARSLSSVYRIALTGTPVENNVADLWAIMEFLNPGWLGTQAEFKRNFFLPIQTQRNVEAAERLKRLTGPFILRRLKTDKSIIADLPDKLEMKVYCTLTKEQASLYEAVVRDAGKSLDKTQGIQRKGVVLATLSKLKQVCNHPAQFLGDNSVIAGRSGKLARLTEMLEEVMAADERALIFSQFAEMGAIIQRYLQETFGQEVIFLHGAVSRKHRDQMVQRFQSDNGGNKNSPRMFVLSLKAGGTGLNLTAANHVFHFDRWWNPAVENQATDRAFRIGQTRNVQVHKFLCAGTLEERIDEMIESKQSLAESIVGTGEGWLTELSTKQLKELFALRRDAVGE